MTCSVALLVCVQMTTSLIAQTLPLNVPSLSFTKLSLKASQQYVPSLTAPTPLFAFNRLFTLPADLLRTAILHPYLHYIDIVRCAESCNITNLQQHMSNRNTHVHTLERTHTRAPSSSSSSPSSLIIIIIIIIIIIVVVVVFLVSSTRKIIVVRLYILSMRVCMCARICAYI